MDNIDDFIEYCDNWYCGGITNTQVVDHFYERFGRKFIFELPTKIETGRFGDQYPVLSGTHWYHSTSEPIFFQKYKGQPKFFILGYELPIDQWLPRSSLTPEEQILFKLKYG